MKKTGILLGGNKLNGGIIDEFRKLGLRIVVVDWNEYPDFTGDVHLRVDVKSVNDVLAAMDGLGTMDVCLAYSSIDLAVPTVTAIHRKYGLNAPRGQAYEKPILKSDMVSAWARHGLLNRMSQIAPAGDADYVARLSRRMKLIIKPNLCSSSRGISILEKESTIEACGDALCRAESVSFDRQAVIEEFFAGREFTVEMLGDAFGNVDVYAISVKYHSQNAGNNKVANRLHYNSAIYSDYVYSKIAEYGRQCYQVLGLNCSFGHLEILMREDGMLSPVEIGARSSGYIASHLASIASGCDYLKSYADILHGASLKNQFYRSNDSSMYYFYDFPLELPCRKEVNLMQYLPGAIQSRAHDRSYITVGHVFRTIGNDTERPGFEILAGQKSNLTMNLIEDAERQMIQDLFGMVGT